MRKNIDLSLLFFRVAIGLSMLMAHGMPKLLNFSNKATVFPDPIGFGSSFSLALAVFAEVFCSSLLVLGLITRLSAIPLLITMLVVFFIIHGADAFINKELSFIYLCSYTLIFLAGPGKYSMDHYILNKRS